MKKAKYFIYINFKSLEIETEKFISNRFRNLNCTFRCSSETSFPCFQAQKLRNS